MGRRGSKWYTNGREEILIGMEDSLPIGYTPGRKPVLDESREKMCNKRKNKIHITNGEESRFVSVEEFETSYINLGFVPGRSLSETAIHNIREKRKRFFQNNPHWTNSTSWKKGHPPHNAGVPMSEESKRKISNANKGRVFSAEERKQKSEKEGETRILNSGSLVDSYTNASIKLRETKKELHKKDPDYFFNIYKKSVLTCLKRYGVESCTQTDECMRRRMQTSLQKYGATDYMKTQEGKRRLYETKLKNNSFHTSKSEESLYEYLLRHWDSSDIIRQYRESRYPFACDFYIKPCDLFIELNETWTHGGHLFDENNEQDLQKLLKWKEKSQNSNFYRNAIQVWTKRDIQKFTTTLKNNLNMIWIYSWEEIYDYI